VLTVAFCAIAAYGCSVLIAVGVFDAVSGTVLVSARRAGDHLRYSGVTRDDSDGWKPDSRCHNHRVG
jgi:hypothetical protein